jgi:hypothetical protein
MDKTIKYGLRIKGTDTILSHNTEATKIEVSDYMRGNEISHHISNYHDNMWLVSSYANAEYVRYNSTNLMESSYEYPEHYYKSETLEIVEVEQIIIIKEIEEIKTFFIKPQIVNVEASNKQKDWDDLTDKYYQFYESNGRKGSLVSKKSLENKKIIAKEHGDFYFILNIERHSGISLRLYNCVSKEDFTLIE